METSFTAYGRQKWLRKHTTHSRQAPIGSPTHATHAISILENVCTPNITNDICIGFWHHHKTHHFYIYCVCHTTNTRHLLCHTTNTNTRHLLCYTTNTNTPPTRDIYCVRPPTPDIYCVFVSVDVTPAIVKVDVETFKRSLRRVRISNGSS